MEIIYRFLIPTFFVIVFILFNLKILTSKTNLLKKSIMFAFLWFIFFIPLIIFVALPLNDLRISLGVITKTLKVNWKITDDKFTPSVTSGYSDASYFDWKGDKYEGSNSSTGTRNGRREITGKYFSLSKNEEKVFSLEKEKYEMRYFRFTDCGDQLCIFGTSLTGEDFGTGSTPVINLTIALWPSKKNFFLSNPCESRQVRNFEFFQLSKTTFQILLECTPRNNKSSYYKGEVDLVDHM